MMCSYNDAITNYKKSLELVNDNSQVHFNLGSAYSAIKKFKLAEKHYKLSIELKPHNSPAHLCLGDVYIEMKRLAKAKATFQEVLKFDRNNEKALEAM